MFIILYFQVHHPFPFLRREVNLEDDKL